MEPLELLRWLFLGEGARPRGLVSSEREWNDLANAIEAIDGLSLWCSSLRRAGKLGEIPFPSRSRLQLAYASTTAQNLELCHEADRLLSACSRAGIAVVPLKGIALQKLGAYRDFDARPTSDIDLLTRTEDRALVTSMLVTAGYRQGALAGVKHLPGFVRGNLLVEIHETAFWNVHDWQPLRLLDMQD